MMMMKYYYGELVVVVGEDEGRRSRVIHIIITVMLEHLTGDVMYIISL